MIYPKKRVIFLIFFVIISLSLACGELFSAKRGYWVNESLECADEHAPVYADILRNYVDRKYKPQINLFQMKMQNQKTVFDILHSSYSIVTEKTAFYNSYYKWNSGLRYKPVSGYCTWAYDYTYGIHPGNSYGSSYPNLIFPDIRSKVNLLRTIADWLGTPYRLGGHSKRGVDCSNFISCLFDDAAGIDFPAGSRYQATLFDKRLKYDQAAFGDILFFTGTNWRSRRVGHVGIYLGKGLFAHSSSYRYRGVVITHMSESSYERRFLFAGRPGPDFFLKRV